MTAQGDKAAAFCSGLPLTAFLCWGEAANPREATLAVGNDRICFILRGASLKSAALAEMLASSQLKITYDAKTAQKILAYFGLRLDYLIDVGANDALIENGYKKSGHQLFENWNELVKKSISKLPREGTRRYELPPPRRPTDEIATGELALCYEVFLSQVSRMKALDLGLAGQIEGNVAPALGEMEYNGIYIDSQKLETLIKDQRDNNKNLESKLNNFFANVAEKNLFGSLEISYDNDTQVQAAAKKLGVFISDFKRESLLNLSHPMGEILWNYRETGRQLSLFTNFAGFLDENSRVHPSYNSFGAGTGRIAVSNPNIQSIPKDKMHRRIVSAPPNTKIITADYATFEMRILAQASGDEKLIDSLQAGKDFHASVASAIFKKKVTREKNPMLRSRAKVMNFGLCYGMSPAGLAKELRISKNEAEDLFNRYFKAMPRIKEYLEASGRRALGSGEARTLSGRRQLMTMSSENPTEAEKGQLVRVAKNMPIQGTNADILKIALARLRRAFTEESPKSRVVNCIHDEIVVETPKADAEKAAQILNEQMCVAAQRFISVVPVEVEVKLGDFWGDDDS